MPSNEEFQDAVAERMHKFAPSIAALSGIKRIIVEDLVTDYCGVCVLKDATQDAVNATGTTIEARNGNIVKNPDITTLHSLINEKNALAPKIIKYVSESELPPEDELDAFLDG